MSKFFETATLYKAQYQETGDFHIGPLPLALIFEEADSGMSQMVTVNLPDNVIPLGERRTFFDINNMPESLLDEWVESEKVEIIGQMQSGFVSYPLIELSEAFYESIEPLSEADWVD